MDQHALIARLREDRGSYPAIAEATGIKYTTLTKITTGATKNPYGRTLKALARYYAEQDRQERQPLAQGAAA